MGSRRQPPLPPEIIEAERRVERWRRTREKRSPMPEELWGQAVELAREHLWINLWSRNQLDRIEVDALDGLRPSWK